MRLMLDVNRLNFTVGRLTLALNLKTVRIAAAVVAVSFFVSRKAMDFLSPSGGGKAPVLAELPPLPPATRSSRVLAPVSISLIAIRDAAERSTARTFGGKA